MPQDVDLLAEAIECETVAGLVAALAGESARQLEFTTKPELNSELLLDVLAQIWQHPETWNQREWRNECGTSFCVAGWAIELSRSWSIVSPRPGLLVGSIPDLACNLLGLPDLAHDSASGLFSVLNRWSEILRLSAELLNVDESVLMDKIRDRKVGRHAG